MKNQNPFFIVTCIASIVLIVAGFVVPPTGVIDGSVLTATGILFGFGAMAQIPHIVATGKEIHFKHGDTEVSVGDGEDLGLTNGRKEGEDA